MSSSYQLIASSTVDLPKSYLDARGIPCALYHFMIDGVQHNDNFGLDMSFADFYELIRKGVMPTTSQPNADEHVALFEPYLVQGKDILYLCFSSGLSGGYNSACVARDTLEKRYPERRIAIVDTLGASSGYGLLVDAVADLRDRGASFEEALAFAEEKKLHVHHWFFSTDLQHYKRGGRVSASSALIGTIPPSAVLASRHGGFSVNSSCSSPSGGRPIAIASIIVYADAATPFSLTSIKDCCLIWETAAGCAVRKSPPCP